MHCIIILVTFYRMLQNAGMAILLSLKKLQPLRPRHGKQVNLVRQQHQNRSFFQIQSKKSYQNADSWLSYNKNFSKAEDNVQQLQLEDISLNYSSFLSDLEQVELDFKVDSQILNQLNTQLRSQNNELVRMKKDLLKKQQQLDNIESAISLQIKDCKNMFIQTSKLH